MVKKMRIAKKVANTIMIATGVVLFWRGAWGLMDLYIHPNDPLISYIISLLFGLIILAVTHHLFDSLK